MSFLCFDETLSQRIKNGIVNHGFMVRSTKDKKEDSMFFEFESEAQEFINEVLETDKTKKMIISEVNLHA